MLMALAGGLGLGVPIRGAEQETVRGADDKWRRYESPHFELFSHTNDKASRRILHDLELLHAAFFDIMSKKEMQAVPVTIYYFDSMRDFRAYAATGDRKKLYAAGLYQYWFDHAVIVLSPESGEDESRRIIFHEYVHHLTQSAGQTPALWFTEGVAELFSTIEEEADGLILGQLIESHIKQLQLHDLLPLEALFAVDHNSPDYHEASHVGLFYAESWGLLHYWFFGKSGLPRRGIDHFLDYIEQETEHGDPKRRQELFQQTMGMEYWEMRQRLALYVRDGKFDRIKLPLPKIALAETYSASPVLRDEISGRLLELDLRINRASSAKQSLLRRLEKNPKDVHALEVLGAVALMDGKGDKATAIQRWDQAFTAGSHNPVILEILVDEDARTLFNGIDILHFRLSEKKTQYLRLLLRRSIECHPQQTQAYEILAWVEATAVQPMTANVNLVQAYLPSSADRARILLPLALVQLRLNDREGAERLLDGLRIVPAAPEILQAASTLRNYLKKQDVVAPEVGAP